MTSAPGRETPGLEPLLLLGARLEGQKNESDVRDR